MSGIAGATNLTSMLQDRLAYGEINSGSSNLMKQPAVEKSSSGPSFEETLKATINDVNEAVKSSDKAAKDFAVGKAENLHDVMISMEKAEVALRTLTAVRSKLVEAYNEIMRMPV